MTRQDVFKSVNSKLSLIGLKEMKKRVNKKFFNMENIVEALYYALISGKNIILYGPGGFGKTEVTLEFIKEANLDHSVIIGYEDMDVEGLLGLPNISKMMDESVYEIAFEKTVFKNPGILVLEEFLDVNPKTAIALKDILTSGGYRQGNEFKPSLISSVIICSNKSPYELSTDNSTAALYKERFPIVVSVDWDDYSSIRYIGFIKKVIGEEEYNTHQGVYDILAELSYRTCKSKEIVSPRIVKDAIEILKVNDYNVESILYLDGLDTSILNEVSIYCTSKNEESKITAIVANIDSYVLGIMEEEDVSTRFIIDSIAEINYLITNLKEMHTNNEISAGLISNCIIKSEQILSTLWSKINIDSIGGNVDRLNNLFLK